MDIYKDFPKSYRRSSKNIKGQQDLIMIKVCLNGATGIDTSNVAAKSDLVCLKAEVDKIDTDKLGTVPTDLSELSNAVDVVKKKKKKKNFTKVTAIKVSSLSRLVSKTQYNSDKQNLAKRLKMLIRKNLILVD